MNFKNQAYSTQLELPGVLPKKNDTLKQREKAIQSMLGQTWKDVLPHISPRSTKELMLQHGKLIALNDGEARIKVSSAPLLRMAIAKLPEIESAFRKAFGTTVKIRMEV